MVFYTAVHLIELLYIPVRVINTVPKDKEDKAMTNKEAKERVFREATARWQAAQAEEARRTPAKVAYKTGKITWNEYLKRIAEDEEYNED